MNEPSQNRFEVLMSQLESTHADVNKLMEKALADLKAGRPLTGEQRDAIGEAWRVMFVALCGLVVWKPNPSEAAAQAAALQEHARSVEARVSPIQKFVNDFVQEWMQENGLGVQLLEGDTNEYYLKHSEVRTEYASGCSEFELPELLMEKLEEFNKDDEFLKALKEEFENHGVHDFVYTECNDSELNSSEIEIEES